MTIAITGASGQLGRRVAELLLTTVDPAELVLTTRNPAGLADLAARGASVRAADFSDPGSLPAAFAGVDRLLLVSTDTVGDRLDQQRHAIAAAVDAGVRHVAYTSVPEPVAANPALVVPDHVGTEEALRSSGARWTMLRNNLYADMQVSVVEEAARSGQLITSAGAGGAAYVSRADCAAAAVAVLTQGGHEDRAYDITGPEALTSADLAALATTLRGSPVELVEVDDDARVQGLEAAGLPAPVAQVIRSFDAAIRGGYLATVSTVVADLTGRQPTRVADLLPAVRP